MSRKHAKFVRPVSTCDHYRDRQAQMRIYMQNPHGTGEPLRFYQLQLQPDLLGGWNLIRESGLQGARGQVTREHFEDRESAERMLIKRRDMQIRRGFKVMFREGVLRELDD